MLNVTVIRIVKVNIAKIIVLVKVPNQLLIQQILLERKILYALLSGPPIAHTQLADLVLG